MTNKTFKPDEVVAIFDNNEETMDRYTIAIEIYKEDGNENFEGYASYTVASNGVCSVWSVGEESFDYEDVTEEDTHIGKLIEWNELPETLQNTIIGYFELKEGN